MRKAALAFESPASGPNPWRQALRGKAPSPSLVHVARAFAKLQEARHEADYDVGRTFARAESEALVAEARAAFANWTLVRGSPEADAFLLALLVRGRT